MYSPRLKSKMGEKKKKKKKKTSFILIFVRIVLFLHFIDGIYLSKHHNILSFASFEQLQGPDTLYRRPIQILTATATRRARCYRDCSEVDQ